jgi:hypothetical protein
MSYHLKETETLARDLLARLSHDYGDREDCPADVEELFRRGEALLPVDRESVQHRAVSDVLKERWRQDAKWGEQNNDPFTYLAVLSEEVGELAQAALHTKFGGHAAEGLYTEAVHTAAVALAIVECLLRGKWRWPE